MAATKIPLAARIVAIADAYDAMSTDRPYKKSIPIDVCEKLLRGHAGKMYDPDLIEVFVSKQLGLLFREEYEGLPYEDGYTPLTTDARHSQPALTVPVTAPVTTPVPATTAPPSIAEPVPPTDPAS